MAMKLAASAGIQAKTTSGDCLVYLSKNWMRLERVENEGCSAKKRCTQRVDRLYSPHAKSELLVYQWNYITSKVAHARVNLTGWSTMQNVQAISSRPWLTRAG